jgi:hypothetical protein
VLCFLCCGDSLAYVCVCVSVCLCACVCEGSWLKVLLLKPQTRQHPLLLQFLGLQPGWGSNELGKRTAPH